MSPARRIIFGTVLCFLAALLAVEAKVAWVADAGGQPNDLTAAKLSPITAKSIEQKAQASQPEPLYSSALILAALPAQPASIPFATSLQLIQSPLQHITMVRAHSAVLFVRPPPSL